VRFPQTPSGSRALRRFAEADLHERNLKLRVFECMMKAGLQFTRDRERANARNEIVEHLAAAMRADKQDAT
jgi:hypothetical protein